MRLALRNLALLLPLSIVLGCGGVGTKTDGGGFESPASLKLFVAAAPDGGGNRVWGFTGVNASTANYFPHVSGIFTGSGSTTVGVAIGPSGRIYAVDRLANRIVAMDNLSATSPTSFGGNGTGINQFRNPTAIWVDAAEHIYIADAGNKRIVRIDDMIGTNWTTTPDTLKFSGGPLHVSVGGDSKLYVSDGNARRVVRMDDMAGSGALDFSYAGFRRPTGVVTGLDKLSGEQRVFVVDGTTNQLMVFTGPDDASPSVIGGGGSATNQFSSPNDVKVSPTGQIFIADYGNARVVRVDDRNLSNWQTLSLKSNPNVYRLNAAGVAIR